MNCRTTALLLTAPVLANTESSGTDRHQISLCTLTISGTEKGNKMELVPIKMGTPLYLVEADSICQFTLSEVFIADEPQETLTAIIKKTSFKPHKDIDNEWLFDVHSYSEAHEIKESSRITNDVWYWNFAANTIICLDFNEAKHSLLLKLDYQIQEAERYL